MNEHLAAPGHEAGWGGADEVVAFFCECSRPTCHSALWITVAEFQDATSGADRWLVAPGHEVPSAGDEVVEARGAYRVVRMPEERAAGA